MAGHACRVTPKGCTPVEGTTATKAWSALFTSQDSARALGYSGAKQFGLQHPRVQRMLQSLPGAARCERYAAWLGQAPPVPALVSWAQHMSLCAVLLAVLSHTCWRKGLAEMQQLYTGMNPASTDNSNWCELGQAPYVTATLSLVPASSVCCIRVST